MSEDNGGTGEPFDLEKLRELISLMEEHGLTEIDLRRKDERWKVRRGPAQVMQVLPPAGFPMSQTPATPTVFTGSPPALPAGPAPDPNDDVTINSPTVGTF